MLIRQERAASMEALAGISEPGASLLKQKDSSDEFSILLIQFNVFYPSNLNKTEFLNLIVQKLVI